MKDEQEQLKQLKKGDEIFIRARYIKTADDGDVHFLFSVTSAWGKTVDAKGYSIPENVILPPSSPKYDPCRLFKKGDKVKLREEVQGRATSLFVTGLSLGKIYTVEHDEFNHTVAIIGDECLGRYSFVHLELVTPVEELNPYYVKETASVYEVFNRNENNSSVAIFFKSQYSIEKAKERAEAERDRLNAEYRKEQK